MPVKVKVEEQEQEEVDIPLFATVEDAVKDIQVDDTVIQIKVDNKENGD